MYAIVEIAGKQYKLEEGITLYVDKIREQESKDIAIDKVLMFVDEENIMVGHPYLDNVQISFDIIGVVKGKKVRGIKFKKRKNYTRTLGHRQQYLQLKVNKVSLT